MVASANGRTFAVVCNAARVVYKRPHEFVDAAHILILKSILGLVDGPGAKAGSVLLRKPQYWAWGRSICQILLKIFGGWKPKGRPSVA